MREYHPSFRENNPVYLLNHVQQLLSIAKEHNNSSSLIYACLDLRIALELLDLNLILASVKAEERELIIKESKPKNGIQKLNKSYGSLKERYQKFFVAVCEVVGISTVYYDFKKSGELQHRLSTYVHSYYMTDEEIKFESDLMQAVFPLIAEVDAFIKSSLVFEEDGYSILGIEIESIPEDDKQLLNEWKSNFKIDVEELKEKLRFNQIKRRN